ncbi:MAG: HEAT repeat domain-containing protein [Methanoregula sp.]|nr:HEAT repeat domain-containing protein [Methanoregula sp.]
MNESARTILKNLIARYGVSLADDPLRCEGLLRDTCPMCSREIFVLVNAARLHVPKDLLVPRHTLPLSLTKGFLAKRLEDELGFSNDAARWAVDCWAEAMGCVDPDRPVSPDRTPLETTGQPHSRSNLPQRFEPMNPALREQWAADLNRVPRSARLAIISGLSTTPDDANIRLLITALGNTDRAVRSAAFDALCNPATGASAALTAALQETDERIAWRAALILGALKSADVVDSLIPLLDRSPMVRDASIWALGEIKNRKAATPLMKLLSHPDAEVSRAVADSLKKIGLS